MQDICIVGGSGFIGSCLVKRLLSLSDLRVNIIDIQNSRDYSGLMKFGDVRNIDNLRSSIPKDSIIINLAAEHRDDVTPVNRYYETNVFGAENICAVAREKGVKKIIFTSSVSVYGFAEPETSECGVIKPFNDYGISKWEAEQIYRAWQMEDPSNRTLLIVRPTVVFGEDNRGNVFNLFKQIASGKFFIIGHGKNCKSIAYVENVAAFLEYGIGFNNGIHIYNYADSPNFSMKDLVAFICESLGCSKKRIFHIPYSIGILIGVCFDMLGKILGKKFSISRIRVVKFCSNSTYKTSLYESGFIAPFDLKVAIAKTISHEFKVKKR